MARLWSSGFELNSVTNNVEVNVGAAGMSIVTSPVRSGTYAAKVTATTGDQYLGFQAFSAENNGPIFSRAYLYITTYPAVQNAIFELDSLDGTSFQGIKLGTTGTLQLYDATGNIGSLSSALSLNTWYRVELKIDRTAAAGSHVVEGRLDGTVFATASNRTLAKGFTTAFVGGGIEGEVITGGGVWYFDDLAINDSTGSFQTTYPGAGSIVHLRPSADGDNHGFTTAAGGTAGVANNYTRVNDVTPDDNISSNADTVLNHTDDYNIDNTPAAIGSGDTISLTHVGVRYSVSSATLVAAFVLRCKKAAAGTVSESTAITPTSAVGWTTNANAAPRLYPLTLYQDPDSSNWTKATLDTAQIGMRISTGNTNPDFISTLWLLVESIPSSVPFPDAWHPSIEQPYLDRQGIVSY